MDALRYLNEGQMERVFLKIVTKTEKRMNRYSEELDELFDKWSKCAYAEWDNEADSSEGECC